MTNFLMLVLAAFLVSVASFLLYRRTPRGWTKVFLAVTALSALAFPVGAIHNAVDALFHVEEPVFFLLAVVGAPLGVLVGIVGAAISAWSGRSRPSRC